MLLQQFIPGPSAPTPTPNHSHSSLKNNQQTYLLPPSSTLNIYPPIHFILNTKLHIPETCTVFICTVPLCFSSLVLFSLFFLFLILVSCLVFFLWCTVLCGSTRTFRFTPQYNDSAILLYSILFYSMQHLATYVMFAKRLKCQNNSKQRCATLSLAPECLNECWKCQRPWNPGSRFSKADNKQSWFRETSILRGKSTDN